MEPLRIQLSNQADYFREIYYSEGRKHLFTYAPTKKAITKTSLPLAITIIAYFVSRQYPAISWLIFAGALISIFMIPYMIYEIFSYFKWKRKVEAFIKRVVEEQSGILYITETSIEILSSDKSVIEKWENIKSATIQSNYILLNSKGPSDYFFTLKSMTEHEFDQLVKVVRAKMLEEKIS